MPGDLLARVNRAAGLVPRDDERRFGVDTWVSDYLFPSLFQGSAVQTTWTQDHLVQQVQASLPGYTAAVRGCPPAFAAQMFRAMVLSQARFTWRNTRASATPGRMFGTPELRLLEKPWPRGNTGLLISLMEWHAGLAGNAFVLKQGIPVTAQTPLGLRLRVLRPDWVGVLWGSQKEPESKFQATALDAELIGYVYWNGGPGQSEPQLLLPADVAHWAPLPNPLTPADGLGESWITAAVRDIQGDSAITTHKLRFWDNAATPNMVVKGLPAQTREDFEELVEMLEATHRGVENAYRTLYLTMGADAHVVGSSFKDTELKQIQGAGETRIAMLGRVPATLLQISEGLQGSSLNEGNFGMARRIFGDGFVHPQLRDLARALEPLLPRPGTFSGRISGDDAELWPDVGDIPLLREDAKDAAEIEQTKATTITAYVKEGFTPDSARAAVQNQDIGLLVHSGYVSVQQQGPAAVMAQKASAIQAFVEAGYTPESAWQAVDAGDLSLLVKGNLVPRDLIADPMLVGAEPGVQAFDPTGDLLPTQLPGPDVDDQPAGSPVPAQVPPAVPAPAGSNSRPAAGPKRRR